jgi:hypothetical protein
LDFAEDKEMGIDLLSHWICRYSCHGILSGYAIAQILDYPQMSPPGIFEMATAIEVFQIAYVVMTGMIIAKERRISMIKIKKKG